MHQHGARETYEVFAFRYAGRSSRKSAEYFAFGLYGDEDESHPVGYYFWLARNPNRTVLIDSGYAWERSRREGRFQRNEPNHNPVELLAQIDISPGDIDHIIVTHMHRDHAGNLDRFPGALVTMSWREYEFCTGPIAHKPLLTASYAPEEARHVEKLRSAGRLGFVDERTTLFPGIDVTIVGGHTAGQMIVDIESVNGNVVVASDALHFYEQLWNDRPHWFFYSLEDTYRGFETLRTLAARPGTTIAPGHDSTVVSQFEAVVDGLIVDLTVPAPGA